LERLEEKKDSIRLGRAAEENEDSVDEFIRGFDKMSDKVYTQEKSLALLTKPWSWSME
jgi:hypothetical protein